ncbi:hypothetical protein ANN_00093 [Periplaneta americana]|uniref:Uncharacterized protein n=1 Tax=Periplaneta americana TaxID=6978 RepID=A0ABQ8TQW6_PERAM|nr:hypothetical protein ANN_00093 [Periplaneta americana]
MPSTVVVVCLVLSFSCSDLVRAVEELHNTNLTNAIPAASDNGNDVKVRITRSDVRATLGDKLDPGFWPARGKRGNSEEVAPPSGRTEDDRSHWTMKTAGKASCRAYYLTLDLASTIARVSVVGIGLVGLSDGQGLRCHSYFITVGKKPFLSEFCCLLSKNLKVRIYKTVILPVVLYGCETWTLTLREEHRLRVFENKLLRKIFGAKRDEVTGEWRKLHNAELHALYSSPDIIRNIKSRHLRWAGHVARMGESRNAYRVLVGRPEGKRPLGRPRHRWEDNIKMDLKEVGYDDRDWINLAQDRDRWRAYVRAAMNLRLFLSTSSALFQSIFCYVVSDERLRRLEPLYADEPRFILLERRDESEDPPVGSEGIMSQDDPFWVARGRRKYDIPYESLTPGVDEDNFWPARGKRPLKSRLRELTSAEEPFWAARGKRGAFKIPEDLRFRRGLLNSLSAEEPFWAARGRRSTKEDLRTRRGLLETLSAEEPFWAARGKRSDENEDGPEKRGLLETLSAEEPFWAARGKKDLGHIAQDLRYRKGLLESSEEPFWAARGKKDLGHIAQDLRYSKGLLESSEEPFWAARGKKDIGHIAQDLRYRKGLLESSEEPFWAARGKKDLGHIAQDLRYRKGLLESSEEPFWAARGKKDLEHIAQDLRYRKGLLESSEEPFWAARGKKTWSKLNGARNRRLLLESLSSEEPFWAARGKRGEEKQLEEKRGGRGNLLDSLSAEEPFWAARGRRGLLDSLSAEEPFWAARGKKDSKPMASPSPEEILSQIRTREINPKIDPWWPVRGKRVVDADSNPEDESFWRALESRTHKKEGITVEGKAVNRRNLTTGSVIQQAGAAKLEDASE